MSFNKLKFAFGLVRFNFLDDFKGILVFNWKLRASCVNINHNRLIQYSLGLRNIIISFIDKRIHLLDKTTTSLLTREE